jgi:hypothetical protein
MTATMRAMAHLTACLALAFSLAGPGSVASAGPRAGVTFHLDSTERATAVYHVACLAETLACTKDVFETFWREELRWTAADARELEVWKQIVKRMRDAAPPVPASPYLGHTFALRPGLNAERMLIAAVFESTSPAELRRRAGLTHDDAVRLHAVVEHFRKRLSTSWRASVKRRASVDLRKARTLLAGPAMVDLVSNVTAFIATPPRKTTIHVHAIPLPIPASELATATYASNHVVVEVGNAANTKGLVTIVLHELTHYLYDGTPQARLLDLANRFVQTDAPQASAFYALMNEALATAVQVLASEGLGVAQRRNRDEGDLYRHAWVTRAARGALRALETSLANEATLHDGFVDAYVRETGLELGDDVDRPSFVLSAVAILPTEQAAAASAVLQQELQPINSAATDEWRQYPRLNLVFLMTNDVVSKAFAESYPEVVAFAERRGFAYKSERPGGGSVFILGGRDGAALADVARAFVKLRSISLSGLLLTID